MHNRQNACASKKRLLVVSALFTCVVIFWTNFTLAGDDGAYTLEQLLRPTYADIVGHDVDEVDRRLDSQLKADRNDALWPIYTYIRADWHLIAGFKERAEKLYESIIYSSSNNPANSVWGDSGIACFALYRWLLINIDRGVISKETCEKIFKSADIIMGQKNVKSMFYSGPILPALPLVQQEIYQMLSGVAFNANMPDKATQYYLVYLSNFRVDMLGHSHDMLMKIMIERGIADPDRIALMVAERLFKLERNRDIKPYLEMALESDDEEVRFKAQYIKARTDNSLNAKEKMALLEEVSNYSSDMTLTQKAIFWQAMLFKRKSGEYKAPLQRLIDEYPDGKFVDSAIYWLGRFAQLNKDYENAMLWYGKLISGGENEEIIGNAIYNAVTGIIFSAFSSDIPINVRHQYLASASKLLLELINKHPDTEHQPFALFWMGRIAEELDRTEESKEWFNKCYKQFPFQYYGLRSIMHVSEGKRACSHVLMQDGDATNIIVEAYKNSKNNESTPATDIGIYWQRVELSIRNTLYSVALNAESNLRKICQEKRLQEFSGRELDALGMLTHVAVMLSLRQDAIAAANENNSIRDRVWLANTIYQQSRDLQLVLSLLVPRSVDVRYRHDLMTEPLYLRNAYPIVYNKLIDDIVGEQIELNRARNSGFIVCYMNRNLSTLLYAIMRNESFFYPSALSPKGALGLFQFMPNTFQELDDDWSLLEMSGVSSRKEYLLDPRNSIYLGARWLSEKLMPYAFGVLPHGDVNLLLVILLHHAGHGKVARMMKVWGERGWTGDVELMLESFISTDLLDRWNDKVSYHSRKFAKWVLADIIIVDIIGNLQ